MVIHIFIITSPILDIHGVQLRESVRESLYLYAQESKNELKGEIMNDSGTQEVRVNLVYPKEEIHETIEKEIWESILGNGIIKDKNKSLDKEQKFSSTESDETTSRWKTRFKIEHKKDARDEIVERIKSHNSVIIIRHSDPNFEAAWALQGAGKVFQMTSKQLRDRDLQKVRNRIAGLYHELVRSLQFIPDILGNKDKIFMTSALETFLVELPIGNEKEEKQDLIRSLWELFEELDYLNNFPRKATRYSDDIKRKNKADALGKQIEGVLNSLAKQYTKFGGNADELTRKKAKSSN